MKQAVDCHSLLSATAFKAVEFVLVLSTMVFALGRSCDAAIFAIFWGSFGSHEPGVGVEEREA